MPSTEHQSAVKLQPIAHAGQSNVIATPERGNFTPVVTAARTVGVSMRVFLAAVTAGQIQLPLYRIGKRRFVRSHDLKRWLETAPPIAQPGRDSAPNPGLF